MPRGLERALFDYGTPLPIFVWLCSVSIRLPSQGSSFPTPIHSFPVVLMAQWMHTIFWSRKNSEFSILMSDASWFVWKQTPMGKWSLRELSTLTMFTHGTCKQAICYRSFQDTRGLFPVLPFPTIIWLLAHGTIQSRFMPFFRGSWMSKIYSTARKWQPWQCIHLRARWLFRLWRARFLFGSQSMLNYREFCTLR